MTSPSSKDGSGNYFPPNHAFPYELDTKHILRLTAFVVSTAGWNSETSIIAAAVKKDMDTNSPGTKCVKNFDEQCQHILQLIKEKNRSMWRSHLVGCFQDTLFSRTNNVSGTIMRDDNAAACSEALLKIRNLGAGDERS